MHQCHHSCSQSTDQTLSAYLPTNLQGGCHRVQLVGSKLELILHHLVEVDVLIRGRRTKSSNQELTVQVPDVKGLTVVRNQAVSLVQNVPCMPNHIPVTIMEV